MQNFLLATTISLLGLGTASAHAQTVDYSLSGGYELADYGGIQLDTITLRGRYLFTDRFGLEGQMAFGIDNSTVDFGALGVADVELDYSFAAYGVYTYPLSDTLSLFGRAGYITTELGTGATGYSLPEDDGAFSAGLGAEWFFNQRDGLRFDYSWADYDEEARYYGISYVRRFGG